MYSICKQSVCLGLYGSLRTQKKPPKLYCECLFHNHFHTCSYREPGYMMTFCIESCSRNMKTFICYTSLQNAVFHNRSRLVLHVFHVSTHTHKILHFDFTPNHERLELITINVVITLLQSARLPSCCWCCSKTTAKQYITISQFLNMVWHYHIFLVRLGIS